MVIVTFSLPFTKDLLNLGEALLFLLLLLVVVLCVVANVAVAVSVSAAVNVEEARAALFRLS